MTHCVRPTLLRVCMSYWAQVWNLRTWEWWRVEPSYVVPCMDVLFAMLEERHLRNCDVPSSWAIYWGDWDNKLHQSSFFDPGTAASAALAFKVIDPLVAYWVKPVEGVALVLHAMKVPEILVTYKGNWIFILTKKKMLAPHKPRENCDWFSCYSCG